MVVLGRNPCHVGIAERDAPHVGREHFPLVAGCVVADIEPEVGVVAELLAEHVEQQFTHRRGGEQVAADVDRRAAGRGAAERALVRAHHAAIEHHDLEAEVCDATGHLLLQIGGAGGERAGVGA